MAHLCIQREQTAERILIQVYTEVYETSRADLFSDCAENMALSCL